MQKRVTLDTDKICVRFYNPLSLGRLPQVPIKPGKTAAVDWQQREVGLLSLVKTRKAFSDTFTVKLLDYDSLM